MNVTAYLMGDPPPGRSALEQRYPAARITLPANPPTLAKKLNAAKVSMIRASEATCRELALQLGVSESTVNDVRIGRTWKHVN